MRMKFWKKKKKDNDLLVSVVMGVIAAAIGAAVAMLEDALDTTFEDAISKGSYNAKSLATCPKCNSADVLEAAPKLVKTPTTGVQRQHRCKSCEHEWITLSTRDQIVINCAASS